MIDRLGIGELQIRMLICGKKFGNLFKLDCFVGSMNVEAISGGFDQ